MFKIIQEAAVSQLSQTSLYEKFDKASGIGANIRKEINSASSDTIIKPDQIAEIISLMKLNGDAIVKKAIDAYIKGDIIVIFNKATSVIPSSLPYIIVNSKVGPKAYIFADKFIDNIHSPQEYTKFMAVLEAVFLALTLTRKPSTILMNQQLMLTLCNIYQLMVVTPLEQKLYMKGDNLVKAMLYVIAYFYKQFNQTEMNPNNIPYKRIISDKVDPNVAATIIDEVKNSTDKSFMELIKKLININPIRYKSLDTMYMTYFTSTCGVSLIFALENISYLFLLMTSAVYKTPITAYGLNKTVNMPVKKAITLLSPLQI